VLRRDQRGVPELLGGTSSQATRLGPLGRGLDHRRPQGGCRSRRAVPDEFLGSHRTQVRLALRLASSSQSKSRPAESQMVCAEAHPPHAARPIGRATLHLPRIGVTGGARFAPTARTRGGSSIRSFEMPGSSRPGVSPDGESVRRPTYETRTLKPPPSMSGDPRRSSASC
jgi:hypothetical protein